MIKFNGENKMNKLEEGLIKAGMVISGGVMIGGLTTTAYEFLKGGLDNIEKGYYISAAGLVLAVASAIYGKKRTDDELR